VAAATFDAIGKEAGYSRGLVTQRFGSKDGLIRSLIAALHGWQREALEAAHVERMDGLAALCAFVELHCQVAGRAGRGQGLLHAAGGGGGRPAGNPRGLCRVP
jgi:AcrR family transcriptional regulator